MDIQKVSSLWSVFIVLTRSLSISLSRIFVVLESLGVFALIAILLVAMIDSAQHFELILHTAPLFLLVIGSFVVLMCY